MSDGIKDELLREFGEDGMHWSCLGHDGQARLEWCVRHLTVGKPEFEHRRPVCFEIGTHHGVSSTIMARLGLDVITLDIEAYPLSKRVWEYFGVQGRISPLVTKGDPDTAMLAKNAQFDLAFIDGCHALESVRANFEAVNHCGRVIFHDYEHKCHRDRTVAFVDALDYGRTTKLAPFAVWESPEIAGCPWGRLAR
jgi:hypothetical protein